MCGIIGYVGRRKALPILISGLKRLEYRGYDSAGIALNTDDGLIVTKSVGKIRDLEACIGNADYSSVQGIAHTRWATHGAPNLANAHPHVDAACEFALVHNGIIENYRTLKEYLTRGGVKFQTDTDTETLVHLIRLSYEGNLTSAVRDALAQVEGTYGIAVVSSKHPDVIVAARMGSPLVIGLGEDENFVGSDVSAMIEHTNKVVYLEDGEVAMVTPYKYEITTIQNQKITPSVQEVSWSLGEIEKEGYDHFMLKEIHEQPNTVRNAIRGRLREDEGISRLNGLNLQYDELRRIKRMIFTACGTSWHAGLIGEYLIEELARVPVEVEYASELRYRSPIFEDSTTLFAISQSGETADTLAAMREAKNRGITSLGIVNVVGSTIARESDGGVYIHAGPEIGVASTKAFTSQVTVLTLIGILLGRMRSLSVQQGQELIHALQSIPDQIEHILANEEQVRTIAREYYQKDNFLYLGRGINYPVALEGALKLKEISYIHAEAYPAGELKHGPLALVTSAMPVVTVAPNDALLEKLKSNMQEVRARAGVLYVLADGDTRIESSEGIHVIRMPEHYGALSPLLHVVPLQLLAYHTACARGTDVDKPRNLAKSVTVE